MADEHDRSLVFLSWSGSRSFSIVRILAPWIPKVIQAIDCWYSASDVRAGSRWSLEVARHLERALFGIICVTRENLAAPWILYEAGALARNFRDESRVCPLLIDLTPADLSGPLAQFQSVPLNEAGMRQLVSSLNESAGGRRLPIERVEPVFSTWWPSLSAQIDELPPADKHPVPVRTDRQVLDEILGLARVISSNSTSEYQLPADLDRSTLVSGDDVDAVVARLRRAQPSDLASLDSEWPRTYAPSHETDSLNGWWESRWTGGSASGDWVTGLASVNVVRGVLFGLLNDSVGQFLFVGKRRRGGIIAGRTFNVNEPRDNGPWACRRISGDIIEALWEQGAWLLRRTTNTQ